MNWKEIKRKYPKAINKLFEWLCIEEYESDSNKEAGTKWYQFKHGYLISYEGFCWNERSLYDFFDEQKIMCYLNFDVELQIWWSNIVEKQKDRTWSGGGIGGGNPKERKKAEEKVFLKAFEILEENQTNQQLLLK